MFSNSMAKLIIGMSRIKYDILNELFKDVKIESKTVNFFIDAHRLYYPFLTNRNEYTVYANDESELVMSIVLGTLNTIGHYRRYLATRLQRSNRIFVVVNRRVPKYQSSLIYGYGEKKFDTFATDHKDYGPINTAINKALNYLQSIIPYFEDVFLINSNRIEECVSMSYIMGCEEARKDFNILYTNSELALQLLNESCVMIYPNQDNSKLVTHKNWANFLLRGKKYKLDATIDPSFVPIYLAIHGMENRGISSRYLRGEKETLSAIQNVSDMGGGKGGVSMQMFLDTLQTVPMKKERRPSVSDAEMLKQLYKAFHIPTCITALTPQEKARLLTGIYNLYDQAKLEQINEYLVQFDDIIELNNLNMNRVKTWLELWEE